MSGIETQDSIVPVFFTTDFYTLNVDKSFLFLQGVYVNIGTFRTCRFLFLQ